MADLKGKVAVITGAASGIGLAGVEVFIAAGAKVIAYDRLITKTANVDYYTTFDNFGVGVLQATDSIAFLSRDVAEQFAKDGLLARLPLRLGDTRMRIGAIWMRERHMAMELKLVHMVLRECTQMIATGEAEAQPPRWPMPFEPQPLHHHEFW